MFQETAFNFSAARDQLRAGVCASEIPIPLPLDISAWIAMSLLQKAIRRGHEGLAQRAAATLLEVSPERLWRRCGGIAFEDIGVADLETVSLVVAALGGKRFRATLGGEWPVASYIVTRMAQTVKCRAADDLLMAADLHPTFAEVRQQFARLPLPELLDIVAGDGPLLERGIALWFAVGSRGRTAGDMPPRRGDPIRVFEHLAGTPGMANIAPVAREGFRKVGEVLCPLTALLFPIMRSEGCEVADDPLPPETLIGEVPSWAYDMYSREGRRALVLFLDGTSKTARWVRQRVVPERRVEFLGGILFRVEGGLVRQRLRWATADRLRQLVDLECHRPRILDVSQLLDLMRDDIPLLNRLRAHV